MKMQDPVESTATVTTSIGSDGAGSSKPTAGTFSGLQGMSFAELLSLADAAYVHFTAIHPDSDNEGKNPFIPVSKSQCDPLPNRTRMLLSHNNASFEQTPVTAINHIPQESQGTSPIASQMGTPTDCCRKTISHFAPPMPDKAIRGESKHNVGMQINVELEKNVQGTNSETPNKRELSEAVIKSPYADSVVACTKSSSGAGSAGAKRSCTGCGWKTISHFAPPTPDKAIRGESKRNVGMQFNAEVEQNVQSTNSETPNYQKFSKAIVESSYVGSKVACTKSSSGPGFARAKRSCTDCCRKTISHFAPPTPDKAIRGESKHNVGMQINVELEKNVQGTNSETPNNRELSETVIKSSYADSVVACTQSSSSAGLHMKMQDSIEPTAIIRSTGSDSMETSVKPTSDTVSSLDSMRFCDLLTLAGTATLHFSTPLKKNHNPDKEGSQGVDLNQTRPAKKKELNKASTTPPTEVTRESTEPIMPGSTEKSCRKSLNSELTEQLRDENAVPRKNMTVHLGKGIDVVEETHVATSTSLSDTNPPGAKSNANSTKNCRRKGLVTTQDRREKTDIQSSKNNSHISSQSGNQSTGLQGGTKRKHSTTDHADISRMNLIEVHWNGLHTYRRSWVQYPDIQKKRRSEKGSNSSPSTTSLSPKHLISYEYTAVKDLVALEATDRATHDRSQAFQALFSLCQTRPTKRRSKTFRFRDFATLNKPASSAHSTSQMQLHHSLLLDGYRPSLAKSLDAAHQVPENNMRIMGALTKKVRHLDINEEVRDTSSHERKAPVPYNQQKLKDQTTQGDGTFIPDEGPFDPIRKRLRRPKVDLDEDLSSIAKYNILDNSTCFSKLLEMASSTKL